MAKRNRTKRNRTKRNRNKRNITNRTKRNRTKRNRTKRGGMFNMFKIKKDKSTARTTADKLGNTVEELWYPFEPFVSIFHALLSIKKTKNLKELNSVIQSMAKVLDSALSPAIPLQQQGSDLHRDTGNEDAAKRTVPNPTLYTDLYKNSE